MTGTTIAWGIAALALCAIAGLLLGMWIGYGRGWDHATEEAEWQQADARWDELAEKAARPVPVRPPVPARPPAPAQAPPAGPGGRHRHPAGPRHAGLPAAGYLSAEPGPWGGTITVPAPAQQPPWDAPPPEPQTEVLEPTAVLPGPAPDPLTDSQFTRRMAEETDRFIKEIIGATDSTLKQITGGTR
jgi:hypothetical protein